jgi:hypothetical protein
MGGRVSTMPLPLDDEGERPAREHPSRSRTPSERDPAILATATGELWVSVSAVIPKTRKAPLRSELCGQDATIGA